MGCHVKSCTLIIIVTIESKTILVFCLRAFLVGELSSMNRNSNNTMYVISTTLDEILKICSILKSSKSAGIDNFSPKTIKAIICNIAQPLCDIFNKSLSMGIFLSKLKIAKVTPIYKAEDRSKVNNYRPISILPIFPKILEKIMNHRLPDFISKNNILCTNQFGFRE